MKKIVFIALSLTILSLAVLPLSAERGWIWKGDGDSDRKCGYEMRAMHKPFMHLNKMQEKLGLTDAQVDRIYNIHKNYMDEFYKNRRNENKIKELHAKQISEIRDVLTPEQKAKWEEMKKNHRHGGKK